MGLAGFLFSYLRGVYSGAINSVMANNCGDCEKVICSCHDGCAPPAVVVDLSRCSGCRMPVASAVCPSASCGPLVDGKCWTCRDTAEAGAKILAMLARAPSMQLNQTYMARKLARRPLSLGPALRALRERGLIERAFSNPNLEKPSATTYKLTAAGLAAVQS